MALAEIGLAMVDSVVGAGTKFADESVRRESVRGDSPEATAASGIEELLVGKSKG